MEIRLTSEITVRLIRSCGGDFMVVAAAKVSTSGEDALKFADQAKAEENAGLINYLMKNRHGTPFEHSCLTFFVHAPAFVWWEWVRHRVAMTIDCQEMSFNLESGRYKQLEPVFWIPRRNRAMVPVEGFKPARPKFEKAAIATYEEVCERMSRAYLAAWTEYREMIASSIANEVARSVLGFGVYYSGWVTCNPRSLMSFLSLRTHDPDAMFVSYPQAEIEQAARVAETFLESGWPLTHAAFNRNGRVGP